MWLLLLRHLSHHGQSYDLSDGVGTDGNGLAELTGELSRAIVGDFDGILLTGLDGCLGIVGHGTSATGKCLMYD